MAEQFSWVPLPCCSPPGCPFPIKSLALSAHVSPQTIHFWVLDKSPFLGPGSGPPSCNKMRKPKPRGLGNWNGGHGKDLYLGGPHCVLPGFNRKHWLWSKLCNYTHHLFSSYSICIPGAEVYSLSGFGLPHPGTPHQRHCFSPTWLFSSSFLCYFLPFIFLSLFKI